MYYIQLWIAMGQRAIWTAAISRNLMLVLTKHMAEWKELKPLLLWVLYFAAVETKDLSERSQLVFMLAVLIGGMQLQEWDDVMQAVKSVLWVEKVFAGSDDLVRDEVMAIVRQNAIRQVMECPPPVFLDGFPGDIEEV
jgi:hypothetical protein